MEIESFEQWRIPGEIAGVLSYEDSESLRGRTGLSERHRHAELELHLVLEGSGTYLIGDERLTVEAGMLAWVPPKMDHILLEAFTRIRRWMMLVRPEVVHHVLGKSGHDLLARQRTRSLCRMLPKAVARGLGTVLSEVCDQPFGSPSLHNAGIEFALARAWVLFSRATVTPDAAEVHPAITRAVRILRDGGSTLTMDQLARKCGLSPSRLSKIFAAEMGISVTEFRNRQRIERFLDFYGTGNRLSISDAALEAGFGSYAQFYRIFRDMLGYTPAEHARRVRR